MEHFSKYRDEYNDEYSVTVNTVRNLWMVIMQD